MAAALAAAGVAVYANALHGPFIYDDATILDDPDFRRVLPPWRAVGAAPESAVSGRPVVYYAHALNLALGGTDVRGFHALNLAVHVLAALVLFGWIRRTLLSERLRDRYGASARGLAFAAALIWTVHPLQTECMNYISQRSESLMGLFYLLTLYAVVRSADSRHPARWHVAAVATCALGMLTKESMVTAPVVVLLYDLVFLSRGAGRLRRERGALYAGLAATWLILAGVMLGGPRANSVGLGLGVDATTYAMNQLLVVARYLRLVCWPHPLLLDYGVPREPAIADVLPQGAVVIALLVLTAVALLRRPAIGFAGAWCFVILSPTSSFVPIVTEVGAERRMYLPLAGLVALGVVAAHELLRKASARNEVRRRIGAALLAAVSIALACATVLRNADYRSAESIWRTVVAAAPGNPRGHNNLGSELQRLGRPDEAVQHLRRAVEIDPGYADAHSNLGGVLRKLGRSDEAVESLRRAIALEPRHPDAHYNLGAVLQSQRRLEEAVLHYREALASRPDDASIHNNLGTALGSLGRLDEAIEHFRRALEIEPQNAATRRNLETALGRRGGD
jgi:tetratricopeptide (TPR) repeat protein